MKQKVSKYQSNFRGREFSCKCCGQGGINKSTRRKIEAARIIAGVPFIINSAYRCPNKQSKLIKAGKSKSTSSHPRGWAFDVSAPDDLVRFLIFDALLKVNFERIGAGPDFIHADDDPEKNFPRLWTYIV